MKNVKNGELYHFQLKMISSGECVPDVGAIAISFIVLLLAWWLALPTVCLASLAINLTKFIAGVLNSFAEVANLGIVMTNLVAYILNLEIEEINLIQNTYCNLLWILVQKCEIKVMKNRENVKWRLCLARSSQLSNFVDFVNFVVSNLGVFKSITWIYLIHAHSWFPFLLMKLRCCCFSYTEIVKFIAENVTFLGKVYQCIWYL